MLLTAIATYLSGLDSKTFPSRSCCLVELKPNYCFLKRILRYTDNVLFCGHLYFHLSLGKSSMVNLLVNGYGYFFKWIYIINALNKSECTILHRFISYGFTAAMLRAQGSCFWILKNNYTIRKIVWWLEWILQMQKLHGILITFKMNRKL